MTPSPRLAVALLLAAVCGAAWYARPAAPAPGSPPLALSAPYTHDNLTVYVVRGPDAFDAGKVLTLQEALDRGLAVVHETGNVNTLAVENRSDEFELFLQSGDIVKGGRQDRLIASDLILSPKSGKVSCPANCCERSRWTGRGTEAATHFAKSTDFAVGNDIKIANATRQQGEVWANVDKAQKQLSENVGSAVNCPDSPTSLQLALENKDLQAKLAGYEKALAGVCGYPDAVGVVVAVNGTVIAADVYGSATLFKKVWPKLLKAAAADALAQLPKGGAVPPAPSLRDAEAFLASAAGETRAEALTELGVVVNRAEPFVGQGQVQLFADGAALPANPEPAPVAVQTGAGVERTLNLWNDSTAAGVGGSAGRSVATRGRTIHAGGEVNRNPSDPQPQPAAVAAPRAGVVVVEAQAPAQPSVTVHRSYLKK